MVKKARKLNTSLLKCKLRKLLIYALDVIHVAGHNPAEKINITNIKRTKINKKRIKTLINTNKNNEKPLPRFPPMYISDNPYYLNDNLLIIGQLRNAELHLHSMLKQLESIACLFNSTTFILFESNSDDNTTFILKQFMNKQTKTNAIHEDRIHTFLFKPKDDINEAANTANNSK
eukprot:8310_1